MTKFTKTVILIAVLFAFHGMAAECQEKKHENAPKVVPFTIEEMQTPDFWINAIDSNPDEVVLSAGEW